MSPGQQLRQAIKEDTIQVPGAPNALLARMIEQHGFEAAYLSGAGCSAGAFALPDIGLLTLTELAQQTAQISERIQIPLIVDANSGFGDTINVERTVIELERAGAAAIQLDDLQRPTECGHPARTTLVSADEMCAKIKAATAARRNPQLVIIARTDARTVGEIDDAIDRGRRYVEAGADWIVPNDLADRDEFVTLADTFDVPLVANMTEFGQSPLLTWEQLSALGYAAILYPVTLQRITMKAADAALGLLAADGTQRELLDLMQTPQELNDLLDYDDYQRPAQDPFGDNIQ